MKGFVKVAAAIPQTNVADCVGNTQQIVGQIQEAAARQAGLIVFPELAITGYSCKDLLLQDSLIKQAQNCLAEIAAATQSADIIAVVGLPIAYGNALYDCAAVVENGAVKGLVPKTIFLNDNNRNDLRWFKSAYGIAPNATIRLFDQDVPIGRNLLFQTDLYSFGIELGEEATSPYRPAAHQAQAGADLILHLTAHSDVVGKYRQTKAQIAQTSKTLCCACVSTSCGFGESTQDGVFGGYSLIAEQGKVVAEATRYSTVPQLTIAEIDLDRIGHSRRTHAMSLAVHHPQSACRTIRLETVATATPACTTRSVNPLPFVPASDTLAADCEEVLTLQALALAKRLLHTHTQKIIIGVSGGLDSTLALIVGIKAFDMLGLSHEGIVGYTMPGFGTTKRTHSNATALMEHLGITAKEVTIHDACKQHFSDIGLNPSKLDAAFENSQARERTQILMDVANMIGALVVGTGDLSELALGWATYNGDHMSMYGVNAGIPKTLIKYLIRHYAENCGNEHIRQTLLDVLDTPVSPELLPSDDNGEIKQKTEDLVGPYELHDFFLYHTLTHGYGPEKIYELAKVAFNGTDKRVSTYDEPTLLKWLTTFFRRFFSQQFKRSCMPDGPQVLSCSLSPRGAWSMPSDATAAVWLKECKELSDKQQK